MVLVVGVGWLEMGRGGRAKRAMPTLAMMKPSRTWGTRIVRVRTKYGRQQVRPKFTNEVQQQIPCGNDRKKSQCRKKGKGKNAMLTL